jgi:uncharacterized protein (DUF1800 family)
MALNTAQEKTAHLLRRAGLGASQAELAAYTPLGIPGAVDALLDYDKVDEGLDVDFWSLRVDGKLIPAQLAGAWWTYRLLVTRRPLQERMVLFWHNHFGCSLEKVKASFLMYQHLNTLRRYALADFKTLVTAVAQDPTMLVFLDGKDNVVGRANENFGRELMELFTLGIGNYTEKDVQQGARAFTGWSIQRNGKPADAVDDSGLPSYRFRPRLHDEGDKVFLGHTGDFDGTDVIDIILAQPAHPRFLVTKLWTWFAYPRPEDAVVDRVCGVYAKSGGSIKETMRAILTAPEFYSPRAERAVYKSPVDFGVGIMRQFDAPRLIATLRQAQEHAGPLAATQQTAATAQALQGLPDAVKAGVRRDVRLISPLAGFTYKAMADMGMKLMFPPSVAGWDGGAAWVNSNTMLQRMKFADLLDPQQKRLLRWQFLLGDKQFGSMGETVDYFCALLDAPLPPAKRKVIADAADGRARGTFMANQARQAAVHEICRLVFASPEFQMC